MAKDSTGVNVWSLLKHPIGIAVGTAVLAVVAYQGFLFTQTKHNSPSDYVPISIWRKAGTVCMKVGNEHYALASLQPSPQDGRNSLYEKANQAHAQQLVGATVPSPRALTNIDIAFNVANNDSETIQKIDHLKKGSISDTVTFGVNRSHWAKTYTHGGKSWVNAAGYGPFCT